MHSIRVICVDSYQAPPIPDVDPTFSQFRASDVKQVPVVRIFGTTLTGEKVCLHVHGVFPYMYVPYSGLVSPDILVYRLAASLDATINASFGTSNSNTQHVYKVQQVSGIPFYGYHKKAHHFLKIYFYNPAIMKRATDLLQGGCILGQIFQPHEAHIPFILQFMIDYNIYGMSLINLKSVKHRHSFMSDGNVGKLSLSLEKLIDSDVEEKEYLPISVRRQSVCQLEMDAWASDILNRLVIDKGIDLNPGIAAIWEEEKARRIQLDLQDSQLMYPKSPERSQVSSFLKSNDIYYRKQLEQRLRLIDSQNEESSLSPSPGNSSYPIPVSHNSNLMNASQLEVHAGPLESTSHKKLQSISIPNVANDSLLPLSSRSNSSNNRMSLSTSDLEMVDILANLAEEQENISSTIDSNSILGSQKSQVQQDIFLDNAVEEDDKEEEEAEDLNITLLDLNSLNFSLWEFDKRKSQQEKESNNSSQIELKLESLKDRSSSNSPDNIPQFDGPIDDENAGTSEGNDEADVTIARQEFLICEYKAKRKRKSSSSETSPAKKKEHIFNIDDEPRRSAKRRKTLEDHLPKTPSRSPSKRLKKITSPGCPSRNYSPLKIQITGGQKNESGQSPSTSHVTRRRGRGLKPKRILTSLKETEAEDERTALITITKALDEKSMCQEEGNDSDKTLVEDSDESSQTIVSPRENPSIINETDSNDTVYSKEKLPTVDFLEYAPDVGDDGQAIADKSKSFFSQLIDTGRVSFGREDDVPGSVPLVDHYYDSFEPSIARPGPSTREEVARWGNAALCSDKELADLPVFRSCLEDLKDLDDSPMIRFQDFRRVGSGNTGRVPDGEATVTIRPIKGPPDRKSAIAWLEARKKQQKEQRQQDEKDREVRGDRKSPQDSKGSDTNNVFLHRSGTFKGIGPLSDTSKHLGTSCGQIECASRSSAVNVEHGNLGNAKALTTYQFLTICCLEVHVITRSNLLPDPQYDEIAAVFYAIHNDVPPDWTKAKPLECGVIVVDPAKVNATWKGSIYMNTEGKSVTYVESETAIFNGVLSIIERCDPEILIGWDIEFLSWGYLFQRASLLGSNLSNGVSRVPGTARTWSRARDHSSAESQAWESSFGDLRLSGRIVLDVWRLMRHEIALTSYTYENVMYHVMNERVPDHSFAILTKWWATLNCQWRVIDHYTNKVIGVHRILHHLDIINRTSEHARLYGIQLYEVFSRGSQFRVESMMLRLAKPLNYIPVSPSSRQRGCMRAPESLPLILEPESTMYTDPVVVLDFQSLYPSIIIAYNYCFSTCLGRIEHIGSGQPFEFGATSLKVGKNLAKKLQDRVNFAPCGVAFVKEEVRKGVLPRMLSEILETRLMVKKAIKDHSREDRALQRALDSRQLGLKLIANVTYGYTAANFSGRMPCIEVGDSVVSKGKETLEGAIKIVESTPKWGARVVYGDTDSLFVLLKGKSREEAFGIGAEIAETVTAANPKPVKLKFEKVMHPCILQTKKRYCGYIYENLNDTPVYLAKGIETVRRDGCPAVGKILEKTLRILFETKDLILVKEYVTRQLDKILTGRVSIQDLIFAKEFRGMKGYKPTACVPALELTRRLTLKDPRAVPRTGSRVPYIIVAGGPNVPLIRCVRSPMELILDSSLRPNAMYYITKVVIPPLNRCLNLIGADAYSWFMQMPHRQALNKNQENLANVNRRQKTTITQYLCNTTCPSCGDLCAKGICDNCLKNQTQTLVVLYEKCRQYERIYSNIKTMCESCIGIKDADSCTSLDCPIFYRRIQAQIDNTQVSYLYNLIQCMEHLSQS